MIALFALLLAIIGATYAYFVAQKGTGGSAQIEVGAGTTDLLSFTNGDKINIVANQDNFKKGDASITEKSVVTATLTPNNTTKIAHDTYNVYLIIENNDFEYTTSDLKPELVLKVINPLGEEVTEMKGFNYDNGFDITNKKRAAYPIVSGYEIDANGEAQVDEWQIEVTLVNLESDQFGNTGKTFTGSILITSKDVETYDLAEIKNMISTSTYKSVNASLELDEGTNTIDKYYYAITETDEEPIVLSISEVADALSYSYHESEEATYEFTTTDDGEKLKPNQNYKIFSYAKDIEGYQSNIYETIVTTDNYEIPVIDEVTYSVASNSITLNVSATPKSANIIKYQYKLNKEDEWHDFLDPTYTINSLDEATVYEIMVRAIDEDEMPSNPWTGSITTGKYGSEEFPYEIKTVEDLVKLSNDVKSGKTYANEYFKLMDNIDFQNKDNYQNADVIVDKDINGNGVNETLQVELTTGTGFPPIGDATNKFAGKYDGNNLTIKNLYIDNNNLSSVGLFGVIENAEISNITITGKIHSSIAATVGGVVGAGYGATIKNAHSYVALTSDVASQYLGGIMGRTFADLNIYNCSNSGDITNGGETGGLLGALVANITVNIEDSYNEGNLTSNITRYFGGLVGRNTYDNATVNIKNSHNDGNIIVNGSTEIDQLLGGIIGRNQGILNIENSYNTGDVKNLRTEYTESINISIGGLIGENDYTVETQSITTKITNSYNTGEIVGGKRTGGLAGYIAKYGYFIIDKSSNRGNVTATTPVIGQTVGGLIGYSNGSNIIVLNSYNTGNITAANIINSGLIGRSNVTSGKNMILNSYNLGKITTPSHIASGLFYAQGTTDIIINNVYNAGTLSGNLAYGIVYYRNHVGTQQVNNTYQLNTVADASNVTIENKLMSDAEMKNANFVKTLNSNIINETTIKEGTSNKTLISLDANLKDYKLIKWKQGTDGYPTLDIN